MAGTFEVGDEILIPQAWTEQGRIIFAIARVRNVGTNRTTQQPAIRVEFHSNPGQLQAHDSNEFGDMLRASTENLLAQVIDPDDVLPNFLDFAGASEETLIRWIKLAIDGRSLEPLSIISEQPLFANLPMHSLGQELFRLALMPSKIQTVSKPLRRDFSLEEWSSDLNDILTWIRETCAVHMDSFRFDQEVEGMNLEHVAALRGDIKLLVWLVEYDRLTVRKRGSMRLFCDNHGRTPLHHAVEHGQISIVDMYRVGASVNPGRLDFRNYYFRSIEDFDAIDDHGQTAMNLVEKVDAIAQGLMIQVLKQLQKQIHQAFLDGIVRPNYLETNFARNEIEVPDFDYLERIVAEFNLRLGGPEEDEGTSIESLYHAAEKGNLTMLRWLVEKMKVGSYTSKFSVQNRLLSLLHIAARRQLEIRDSVRSDSRSVEGDEESKRAIEVEKQKFFSECNMNSIADLEKSVSKFSKSNYSGRTPYSWVEGLVEACGESGPKRADVVRWLIQKGSIVPACDFIVNECDYETAFALLEYRLDVNGIIAGCFCDSAPQAMDLVKIFLYTEGCGGAATPDEAALLCVQRYKQDPQNRYELSRLKLLQRIVDRYTLDPVPLVNSEGKTILQIAIENDFRLIAFWLSVHYRQLLYMWSSNGKLPVHSALENDNVSENMCVVMLASTSEKRSQYFPAFWSDERLFVIADEQGKTVRDYALACRHKSISSSALEPQLDRLFSSLLKMIGEANNSISHIVGFSQENKLNGHLKDADNSFSLLHMAIISGRLDVLCWLDRVVFGQDLARELGNADKNMHDIIFMVPIFCCLQVVPTVGVLIEVACSFRVEDKVVLDGGMEIPTSTLDGIWEVKGWLPINDVPGNMVVYDFCGRSEIPGLSKCAFEIKSSGLVQMKCDDCWISTSTIDSNISKIDFRRSGGRYVETERILTMTKIAELGADNIPETWRLAEIIDVSDTKLQISYQKASWHSSRFTLGNSFDEWIPKDSSRINRSGILKLNYYERFEFRPCPAESKISKISGREFALRCGQSEIIDWIDSADALTGVEKNFRELDVELLRKFLSDVPESELERLIADGRKLLDETSLPVGVIASLESTLYVLGRCWAEQPVPDGLYVCSKLGKTGRLPSFGLFGMAVDQGRIDRVRWILHTNRLALDSPHLRKAAIIAAQNDNLEIVQELLSLGVEATEDFTQFTGGDDDDEQEINLLDIAIRRLSGKVACFLLDSSLIPDEHLSNSLIHCVGSIYFEDEKAVEKAEHRVAILSRLCARGIRPTTSSEDTESTMHILIQSLDLLGRTNSTRQASIDSRTLHILCEHGGDIVSEFDRYRSYSSLTDHLPSWLTEYIDNVRADEELIRALLCYEEFSSTRADELVGDALRDVLTVRDRSGRSLLQVAAVAGKIEVVKWLASDKGADVTALNLDRLTIRDVCQQLGHTDIVAFLDSLTMESAGEE